MLQPSTSQKILLAAYNETTSSDLSVEEVRGLKCVQKVQALLDKAAVAPPTALALAILAYSQKM